MNRFALIQFATLVKFCQLQTPTTPTSKTVRLFRLMIFSFCIANVGTTIAATSTPAPDLDLPGQTNAAEGTTADDIARDKKELTTITPAPPVKVNHNSDQLEYFYPYRKSMSPRAGVIYDTRKYREKGFIYSLGLVYLFPVQKIHSWEAGFDVVSDGTGQIHGARRFFWSRGRVRPFHKFGLGLRLVPSQELTTLIRIDNFQGRAAIGVESLLAPPMSLRMDLDGAVTIKGVQLTLNLGYSWAW